MAAEPNVVIFIADDQGMGDFAGVTPSTMQGQSLCPLLKDPEAPGRKVIFAEANWHDFEQFTRAARTPRFLLSRRRERLTLKSSDLNSA
jgi:hypothetical protein